MEGPYRDSQRLVRVWITEPDDWRPNAWTDVPVQAIVVGAAAEAYVSISAAALFIEGFNGEMLRSGASLWAIAVPVTVRFDQDLAPGVSDLHQAIHLV